MSNSFKKSKEILSIWYPTIRLVVDVEEGNVFDRESQLKNCGVNGTDPRIL